MATFTITDTPVVQYNTKTAVALVVYRSETHDEDGNLERTSYRYTGKYDAGCGDLEQARNAVASVLRYHPRVKLAFGGTF